jgi:predicted ribosomally synthesized peptide with SipW-like signal peptide
MKKIIGLSIAAIIIIALAGGSTFAFFSDTAKSSDNQIQAGSLYLTANNTAFFQTATQFNNIKPGTTYDEYLVLTPGGTITSNNTLSIQMKNMWVDQSGFLALVSPIAKLHKLDGTAYQTTEAGDLGKGTKVVFWLSTGSSPTPSGSDIVIKPGVNGGSLGTFTSVFSSTSWSAIWISSAIANYNYAGYFNVANSPTIANTSEYHWNNVLVAMATTPYYFHVTFNFPDSGSYTDNIFQAEKVTTDLYFTLATTTTPY